MTAVEIIGLIGTLPREERQKVIDFAHHLESREPLSPEELGALATRLAGCQEPNAATSLREQILKGFYGDA